MANIALDNRGVIVTCSKCGRNNRLQYQHLGQSVRCANCKESLPAPASPIEVSQTADFDQLVAASPLPIVVDYWAPWCGPCRMVAREMETVAAHQAGRLLVVKVNTDALPDLGVRFGIRSIPTLAVFAGGREVARTAGARPATDIEMFVEQSIRRSAEGARGYERSGR